MRAAILAPILAFACATAEPLEAEAGARVAGYELEVVDESGHALPTYWHRGRAWVLGELDRRYAVRIWNRTGRRVEAVVTVDGRDVVSGRPGDFRGQRGYVIAPYSSVTIDGFRRSLDAVAAFRFGTVAESYAARMGDARSVGVIGAAIFPERAPVAYRPPPRPRVPYEPTEPYYEPYGSRDRAGGADEASGARGKSSRAPSAAEERPGLGTVYGEHRSSQAQEVPFRRARPGAPDVVLSLRYDDRDGLVALGIPIDRPFGPWDDVALREHADPFPSSRFAPPPPYAR